MSGSRDFVWFWTFWHWSRESCRVGTLLRDPLHGLGGNWNAWYNRHATDQDLDAITKIESDAASQRLFVSWLLQHWSREADDTNNRSLARFVLTQLALVAPFD